jgi:hypothetical protein
MEFTHVILNERGDVKNLLEAWHEGKVDR